MAIQNDNTILNKGDLKAYHQKILPYLGGNIALQTNNSDYYSTEEKVVGVWTDGKPLYQKVTTGNTPPSTSDWTLIASLGNTCNIRRAEMYVESSLGLAPVPFGMSNIRCYYNFSNGAYSIGDISMHLGDISSTNWTNLPLYVIVQYTKTTDTANSALTTPGAYDINFPNTWVTDKEIFFGNGVYGFRIKGNLTATTANSRWTIDPPALAGVTDSFRIRSQGGCYSVNDKGSRSIAFGTDTRTGTSEYFCSSSVWVRTASSAITGVRFSVATGPNCTLTTNDYYDFWITYTK